MNHADSHHPEGILMNNHLARVSTALTLMLVLGLCLAAVSTTTAQAGTVTARAGTVKGEVKLAQKALAVAVTQTHAGNLDKAKTALAAVRKHGSAANNKALNLIGAPPTDPESDEAPGPPAVVAATTLDYKVSVGVGALFDGSKAAGFVKALRATVGVIQNRRADVLNKVVKLPAEGAGADYADGMADTLPMYTREVKFFQNALSTFNLSDSGREGISRALARARAAKAKVDRAFGGGERLATLGS